MAPVGVATSDTQAGLVRPLAAVVRLNDTAVSWNEVPDYVSGNAAFNRLVLPGIVATYDDSTSEPFADPNAAYADAAVKQVAYAVPAEATKLNAYMTAVGNGFDKRIQHALGGIDAMPKRLLAMKYYLRRQGNINASWVWTKRQVESYRRSAEYHKVLAQVEQVRQTFAEQNPGYSLHIDTEVRSLADQVEIWNSAPSVLASGKKLYADAIKTLADSSFAETPDALSLAQFRAFLAECKVPITPTAAVPGFSQHGQLRAFDFIIWAGDTAIVAGADAGSATMLWDRSGWSDKLKGAVASVSDRFEGPLAAPHEPWHYAYAP
jgi:hypothetical protein